MRIVFAGTPPVAVPTLDALVDAGHEIVAVVTRPDAPVGRRRRRTPSAVAARAAELGLPIVHATALGADETARIATLAPELGVIVAYGGLVREPLLSTPAHGWINLHFSLLPRWRGAAPVQRALMAGERTTGVSVFTLEEGLDTGPLHLQREVPIGDGETADELLERLGVDGADDVRAAVDAIAVGTASPSPQLGEPTTAAKLTTADGHIDWRDPADVVHARIRGVTSEPGASSALGDGRLKILRAGRPDDDLARLAPSALGPGEVVWAGKRVLVGTGDRPLELLEVQPPGKRPMRAADWLRGVADGRAVLS